MLAISERSRRAYEDRNEPFGGGAYLWTFVNADPVMRPVVVVAIVDCDAGSFAPVLLLLLDGRELEDGLASGLPGMEAKVGSSHSSSRVTLLVLLVLVVAGCGRVTVADIAAVCVCRRLLLSAICGGGKNERYLGR